MKITYPECQIEISTEEIIDLLDHFIESTSSRQHESTEEPDKPDEEPAPTFEPGGFVPDDEQPAPKPYPNLTDNEAIVQRGEGFLNFIKQGLEEAEAQGKLPEELTHVEIPKEENTPVEIPSARKHDSTKKKKASSNPKKSRNPLHNRLENLRQRIRSRRSTRRQLQNLLPQPHSRQALQKTPGALRQPRT